MKKSKSRREHEATKYQKEGLCNGCLIKNLSR